MIVKELTNLRDTPVIVVNDDVHKEFKIAIIRSKYVVFPVCVMPASHPDVNVRIKSNEVFVSSKVLEAAQASLEDLDIKFVSEGLFVYGTLLSEYITPDGRVWRGWGGLDRFPRVRGVIRDYIIYYDGIPYAVCQGASEILGEVYFDVSEDVMRMIDGVERKAGYKEIMTQATIIENFPLIESINVKLYEYEGKPRGLRMRTMLFGDAFSIHGKMVYFEHNKYFSVLRGNCPIVITAPHGGYYRSSDFPKKCLCEADEETYELAMNLVKEIYKLSNKHHVPSAVLARIHRSRVDLNREEDFSASAIARKYHDIIAELTYKRKALLVDIHGMSIDHEDDIEIGTNLGRSISGEKEIINMLVDNLEKEGFSVCVDKKFTGGFTIRKHGGKENIIAIQIEINKRLRTFEKYRDTAEKLARALWEVLLLNESI